MCQNKSSPPPPNHDPHVKLRTTSRSVMKMIKEEEEVEEEVERLVEIKALVKKKKKASSVRPKRSSSSSGKSRSRKKKTKYLSLSSSRLSAAVESFSSSAVCGGEVGGEALNMTAARGHHQLNLFPLHPEVKAEESDDDENDDVAMLFKSDGGATLHGLLMTSGDTATTTASTLSSDRGDQATAAAESISYTNYGYNHHHHHRRRRNDDEIVRTAMRGGGGDMSLEKWVSYSELVKEEIELTTTTTTTTTTPTTTTSSASTCCNVDGDHNHYQQDQRLSLKLDYDEILNAWSDKGSFYIKTENGESPPRPPQTVPDLLQDELFLQLNDSSGNIENLWCVPEEAGSLKKSMQRQASVLKYKQKRETRLFSKRIRYEVRKLNAEKRPRMKGRFVKSNS